MAFRVAGHRRSSPLVGDGRQRTIACGPACRRENRLLGAHENRCPCHLGDRLRTLRPAQLHLGGGIPQVIMGRRHRGETAAGHDRFGAFPSGFGLADPLLADGQRCLSGGLDPVAPIDHAMDRA